MCVIFNVGSKNSALLTKRKGVQFSIGLTAAQTTGYVRDFKSASGPSGYFPLSSHKISTVNLRHSSHLGTKSNHSASTNVLLPSFTAQATGFFIWKSDPREADDDNYRDYNTSLHVSLRTLLLQR